MSNDVHKTSAVSNCNYLKIIDGNISINKIKNIIDKYLVSFFPAFEPEEFKIKINLVYEEENIIRDIFDEKIFFPYQIEVLSVPGRACEKSVENQLMQEMCVNFPKFKFSNNLLSFRNLLKKIHL